jgi:hypothetical protein
MADGGRGGDASRFVCWHYRARRGGGARRAGGEHVLDGQLGWTPFGSSLAPGVTLGGTVAPAGPGLGTVPGFLAFAHAGSGYGTSLLGANLTLAIPPQAATGPYLGALTVTAIPALP